MEPVSRVGVVGCGTMGCGIAEVSAVAGLDVVVCEVSDALVGAGRERVVSSLQRKVRSGRTTDAGAEAALARMRFSTDLGELRDRELVVEAIIESEGAKTELFSTIDGIVDPGGIFATNTSSYPIVKLARSTRRPDRFIGLHFFNPVPVLALVEVTPSLLTSAETLERVERFATEALGKTAIRSKDRAGFIVNTLLIGFLLAAIRMLDSGFASAADIDAGMVNGCAHPMGPLALSDLIGLDTVLAVANSLYDEFKDPSFAAPPLLSRMVEAGLLGKKSGRGFYGYE